MRNLAIVLVAGAVVVGCASDPPTPARGGEITITADDTGFSPSVVTLRAGSPTTLVFLRTTDATCATEVVFPDLAVKQPLPKGEPVRIDIPTDTERTLTFQCGMGMYKSSVVIAAR